MWFSKKNILSRKNTSMFMTQLGTDCLTNISFMRLMVPPCGTVGGMNTASVGPG